MVRPITRISSARTSAPHPRGDGPPRSVDAGSAHRCSPPAWGWSAPSAESHQPELVLPTRVGMVRMPAPGDLPAERAPHPRGDGPVLGESERDLLLCSPPAWGWSGY